VAALKTFLRVGSVLLPTLCLVLAMSVQGIAAGTDLPAVVVTGVRPEEDQDVSPGAVTVIRPEETEGEGKTLADLLEQSPGVHVVRLRGRGGYTVASVRGSTAAQVAVYVDGRLVNSASESAVDLASIPVSAVERVEIYRGYVPARFGVSGMGAVISVTTRRPSGYEGAVLVEGGTYGEWRTTLRYGNELGGGRYLAVAGFSGATGDFSYRNDNGTYWNPDDDYEATRRNNAWREKNVLFRWEDDEGWNLRAEYFARSQELPRKASGGDKPDDPPGADLDTTRTEFAFGRSASLGKGVWSWNVGYVTQEKEFYDPLDPRTLPLPRSTRNRYETTQWHLLTQASLPVAPNQTLDLVARASRETLDVRGDAQTRYDLRSDYDQDALDLTLADTVVLGGGTLFLVPTVRWNSVDGEGNVSWSLAAEWRMSEALRWKASWGKYHRAPNLYERYGDGALIVPRPDLRWESGTQFDLGVHWAGTVGAARVAAGVTWFSSDVDDLIEFVMASPYVGYYDNIGKSLIEGVEVEVTASWKRWDLLLSYTYTNGENRSPGARWGKPLPNRPRHALFSRLSTALSASLDAFAEVEYVSENWFDQTGDLAYEDLTTVGLGVKWFLPGGGTATLGVRDLFDASSDRKLVPSVGAPQLVWYPDAGRTWYLSFSWTL